MKNHALHTDVSAPHSVTSFIKLRAGHHSTQIGFTDQRVSPHGGLVSVPGFLGLGWRACAAGKNPAARAHQQ